MMRRPLVKVCARPKQRHEGRDEVFMVRFALLLAGVVAAIATYQIIAWSAG
jgi:hypothetical protein